MSLVKNSLWNVLAVVLPSAIAIPSLGMIARILGVELFGVFTLIFALVGYANIFDMGLSRAVVRNISMNRDAPSIIKDTLFTASSTVFVAGCLGGFLLFVSSSNLVEVLSISDKYLVEVKSCFQLMSFIIPVFLLNIVWLSYLEGQERFKELSFIRMITGSLMFLLPVLSLLIKDSIINAFAGLFLARILSLAIILIYSLSELKALDYFFFNRKKFNELVTFGSWLTVSNIISPIMAYFDRFILSAHIGADKVAFYTAPAEIVSRMLLLPHSLGKALFPYMAINSNTDLEKRSLLAVFVVSLTMAIPLFVFGSVLITLWLGPGYQGAVLPLQILLVGFVFNAMAQVPYSKIQALGYSKITAKIHLFELLPYLFFLYFMINNFGIVGAAVAWSARVAIDFFILVICSFKLTGHISS